jgi:hypothetical protein
MLFDGMRVVAIDPKDRILNTVANAIATHIIGHLPHPAHAKCCQGCIVEIGGTANVRAANSSVVNHRGLPQSMTGGRIEAHLLHGPQKLKCASRPTYCLKTP